MVKARKVNLPATMLWNFQIMYLYYYGLATIQEIIIAMSSLIKALQVFVTKPSGVQLVYRKHLSG